MYKNKVKWGRKLETIICFNPCFNGSMYKNRVYCPVSFQMGIVSILVLMDLCIKTIQIKAYFDIIFIVSILVLMDLCIKTYEPMK